MSDELKRAQGRLREAAETFTRRLYDDNTTLSAEEFSRRLKEAESELFKAARAYSRLAELEEP